MIIPIAMMMHYILIRIIIIIIIIIWVKISLLSTYFELHLWPITYQSKHNQIITSFHDHSSWEVSDSGWFMFVSAAQRRVMQEGDLSSHRALGVTGSCGPSGLQAPQVRGE